MDKEQIAGQLRMILELTEKGEFDTVLHSLEKLKVKSLVSYYINGIAETLSVEDEVVLELLIKILQEIYNNSLVISPISDEDYDQLYEVHRDVSGKEIVGAGVGAIDGAKLNHKYEDLRGTLDKIHFMFNSEKKKLRESRKSLEDWINSTANRLGRPFEEHEVDVMLFPKWDGISIVFENDALGNPEQVLTRGDMDKNEAREVTRMFKGNTNFDYLNEFQNGEFGLKTEVVMPNSDFEKFCKDFGEFKTPLSAVSAIFNGNDLDKKYLKYLMIVPLQIQDSLTKEIRIAKPSLTDFPCIKARLTDIDSIREGIHEIQKQVDRNWGVEIDGVVIRLVDPHVQKLLGRLGRINKYEVAYKFPPETKKTRLLDIEDSVGILGAITPVAVVEPVKLKGKKITNISLGSPEIAEELQLRKGQEVIIKYAVIPGLEIDDTCDPGHGETYQIPTHCPRCDSELQRAPVLRCINQDCTSRRIGKIMNYVEKMRIANISIGKITDLYDAGFLLDIQDLYNIEKCKRDIALLPKFGEVSVQKIIDGVDARRTIYDYEFMGALGIVGVGREIFKKIFTLYTLDELLDLCITKNNWKKLTQIAGIKEKTAMRIYEGLLVNEELIRFLRSELNIQKDDRKYTIKVLFTKVRDEEFAKYLDSINVLVLENYSKDVDMVIIPKAGVTSKKVTDAQNAGKEIVTLEDAHKMFNYNP